MHYEFSGLVIVQRFWKSRRVNDFFLHAKSTFHLFSLSKQKIIIFFLCSCFHRHAPDLNLIHADCEDSHRTLKIESPMNCLNTPTWMEAKYPWLYEWKSTPFSGGIGMKRRVSPQFRLTRSQINFEFIFM